MWILPHALGFSVFHYVIRVRQAPYSPNFELEHIVPDSKDIMLIASLLTLINAALISMLWSYGAIEAKPVVLLLPSHFLFAFTTVHLAIGYLVWRRIKKSEAITTAMNAYSFVPCVIGFIRIRISIQG